MPRKGENIYKRKDSRWEGRYVKGHDYTGKVQFGYVYAKTYNEVREKLNKAKVMHASGKAPKENKKFSYYCDQWLLLSRNRIKESTYVKYFNTVEKHLKPVLGHFTPYDIDTVRIEEFSNELLLDGLKPKTVKDILTVLRSVLKHCNRQIEGLPAVDVIYPKEYKKEMRVLTLEEQQRFFNFLLEETDAVKFGILLALLTGMRIGEICALKWKNISLKDKTVSVYETMQRLQNLKEDSYKKTKIIIDEAKSETSKRVIPLTDSALKLCKKMRSDDNAFVLTGSSDKYIEPRALQYRFNKYVKSLGLENVHFHTIRHTFATRCVEVGFEIKSLSEVLGHSSAKITLDRYVHPSLELKRANMDKLALVGL